MYQEGDVVDGENEVYFSKLTEGNGLLILDNIVDSVELEHVISMFESEEI